MTKKEILILDDKEAIGKILINYLSDLYDCVYYNNPLDGIRRLEEGNIPDLIILDLRMPFMTGDEFLFYIKNNELFKSVPVVVLSSEDSSADRIRLLENGVEDYILKPFNPLELKVRLKRILK